MRLKFLGGVDEVGRLGMLLGKNNAKFLFDYGLSPTRPPRYPLPSPPVDIALLSHAHVDHSGMMPWVSSRFQPPIIATQATAVISGLLTRDSLKVAAAEGYVEHYSKKDIRIMEDSFDKVEFGDSRDKGGFEINFHSAGHIPGATMFELKGESDILFTGDINTINTRLVWGCHPIKCDTLIMESTYSGRNHPNRNELEKEFLDAVDEVVGRGGTVVIPAFAVGRTQEMLLLLKDSPYDIWLDGMGKEVTRQYRENPDFLRSPKELKEAFHGVDVVHSHYGRRHALKGDIIITTSGMLDGGPVIFYLEHLKKDSNSAVFLTGYQVEETNGRLLLEKGMVNIQGVKERIEMDVRFFDFSAHASHSQLRKFANKCDPSEVVLFHSDQREILANDLREDGLRVLLPMSGEEIELSG